MALEIICHLKCKQDISILLGNHYIPGDLLLA